MRRVVASVLLIFFGFAVAACGNEEAEGAVSGDYAKTGGLSTDDFPVDNQAPEGAQADGRMLKPEGHKGVWFETEPENPWEHYVWESQKYVGDPLELPKLKGQRPNDPLEGLPDVCDEKVVERMKEVGFELQDPVSKGLVRACYFVEQKGIQGPFSEEIFNVAIDPTRRLNEYETNVGYDLNRKDLTTIAIERSSLDNDCGVALKFNSSILYARLLSSGSDPNIYSVCALSEYFFQILGNVTGL